MPHAAPLSIDRVTLAVRDLDRVAQFYQSVLGLAVLEQAPGTATLGALGREGEARPFLVLREDRSLRPVDPAQAGLFHVAYLLPSREDLGRWLAHASGIGLALDGAADHLVSEAVYLHDPEGNGIEIYRDRPRQDWSWSGDQVIMANNRLDIPELMRNPGRWDGAPPGTAIGHVHLQVGDTEAAEGFYAGTLGFAVTRRWPQALFLSTGGYHHHLAANTWRSAGAGPRDPDRAGLAEVTLRADQTAARRLASRPEFDGTFVDPWGTRIRVPAAH